MQKRIHFRIGYSGHVTFLGAITSLSWRNNRLVRLLGSAGSWLLFSLSFSLLMQSVFGVMAIGGTCASGNTPFVIAHQCPDITGYATPAIFGGLIAVAISVWLTAGFGTSLVSLAWPIVFGVLGALFVSSRESIGFILGGMFIVMALIPFVLALRASAQRVFLGAINLSGRRFDEGERARPTPLSINYATSDNPVRPNMGNWTFSLVIAIGASALGYVLALTIAGAI